MLSMNFFVNLIGFLPLTDLALLLFNADYSSKRAILLKSQQKWRLSQILLTRQPLRTWSIFTTMLP